MQPEVWNLRSFAQEPNYTNWGICCIIPVLTQGTSVCRWSSSMDTVLQITLQMSSYYMSICGRVKCFHVRVCSMSTADMSGLDNPDMICKCQYVVHFINIQAGIIMSPYMLTSRLTAQQYCNFLKILWLLEDTPPTVWQRSWFQYNRGLVHKFQLQLQHIH